MKRLILVFLLGTVQLCLGALPTITFNSGTGSDTAASGSGGTAVTAGGNNAASTTAAANTVDLSADAPDLSGVATDGSMTLWVDSSSGRKHSKITAVNDGTDVVTTQDNYANTESGRNWGIGGKRATLAGTTQLGSDVYGGWTVSIEDNQTITANYVWAPTASAADGMFVCQGDSTTSRRIITQSSNAAHFSFTAAVNMHFRNFTFKNTNGTKTSANLFTASAGALVRFSNCIIGDATDSLAAVGNRTAGNINLNIFDSEIKYLTSQFGATSGNISFVLDGCWIHNNAGHGVGSASGAFDRVSIRNCVINANANDGINMANGAILEAVSSNTIHGNAGDGLQISNLSAINTRTTIINNNITANGAFGFICPANADEKKGLFDFNNYGAGSTANTSGAYSNVSAGANDILVDPGYVSPSLNDFRCSRSVKSKAFPIATTAIGAGQSMTISNGTIGSAQSNPSAFANVINQ